MNIILFIQMVLAAIGAVFIYTLIGFIPGTDETSVLMPITLSVVLAGIPPIIVLTFFIAAIVTLNLTNAIPTALVGLPGGVMSSPMMEFSLVLKDKGLSPLVIKKMAAGSLIGVLVSLPTSLLLANFLSSYSERISTYAPLLFLIGSIFLALMGRNKILSLLSILPLSLLFMGLRYLYWGIGIVPEGTNVTVSFFLGITIGPLVLSLLSLLNKTKGQSMIRNEIKKIIIPKYIMVDTLNPFKIMTREEIKRACMAALIVNFLFVLSPVGLTILFGELAANRVQDPIDRANTAIATMASLTQSTYLSGIIIPLIAIGIPLSPIAIGPGAALFNAPPVFTINNNLYHILDKKELIIGIITGAVLAIGTTYFVASKFATNISTFVLKRIPHEAVLSLFISFILLLAYLDAGLINIFGVLLIGITSGTLNKMGVSYGVQFMTLYAAPWILEKFPY